MNDFTLVLAALAAGLCIVSPTARCETDLGCMLPPDVRTVGLVSVSSIIPKDKFERGTNLLARAGYRVKAMPNVRQLVSPDERARIWTSWSRPARSTTRRPSSSPTSTGSGRRSGRMRSSSVLPRR